MNTTVVGAFVLLLGALLVMGVLWLASGGHVKTRYDHYLAIERESVAGLNLNAPVKYNGVEVGKVRAIRLDPQNPEHVRLVFAIERGTPVRQDTVAVLKTQGITGIAYVELVGGAPGSPALPGSDSEPYPEIRTKPSLSVRLEDVLTMVLAKLDKTSGNLDALLSAENRAAFKSALKDIATVAHTIAAREAQIGTGIADAAQTARNSARATARLDRAIERIGPLMDRVGRGADAVTAMGNEVAAAGTSGRQTLDEARGDLRKVSTRTLPELHDLIGELRVLARSMTLLSHQIERDPASLLRGPGPTANGPGETTPLPPKP